MSAVQRGPLRCEWTVLQVIPWYRHIMALIFGGGVVAVTLWAIQQGSGRFLIGSVTAMSFLTLLMIYGVEIDRIELGDKVVIDFSQGRHPPRNDGGHESGERETETDSTPVIGRDE